MPGAAHALAGDETLGQRAVIMRAMRADGENVIAALLQQHLLVADMAEELTVDKVGQRDTLGQVRTLRCVLIAVLGHRCAPTLAVPVRLTRSCRETAGEARHRCESIPACGW